MANLRTCLSASFELYVVLIIGVEKVIILLVFLNENICTHLKAYEPHKVCNALSCMSKNRLLYSACVHKFFQTMQKV